MKIFNVFSNLVLILLTIDFIINFSYYRQVPAFGNWSANENFKSKWHERYNYFTGVLVCICAVGAVIRWIFF